MPTTRWPRAKTWAKTHRVSRDRSGHRETSVQRDERWAFVSTATAIHLGKHKRLHLVAPRFEDSVHPITESAEVNLIRQESGVRETRARRRWAPRAPRQPTTLQLSARHRAAGVCGDASTIARGGTTEGRIRFPTRTRSGSFLGRYVLPVRDMTSLRLDPSRRTSAVRGAKDQKQRDQVRRAEGRVPDCYLLIARCRSRAFSDPLAILQTALRCWSENLHNGRAGRRCQMTR